MGRRLAPLLALLAVTAGCSGEGAPVGSGVPAPPPAGTSVPTGAPEPPGVPDVQVTPVASGLEHAWDIGFLPDGSALVTERPGRIRLLPAPGSGAAVTEVRADTADVYVRGEGGLMGLVVHPDFADSRRFSTCQTHAANGEPVDVRLVTWELSPDGSAARRVADPLVGGLPLNSSGRHSGCRPTLGPDGMLYVGTGDSAAADVSQDLGALGGKVLRVDPATGAAPKDNPFAAAADPRQRLVFSYGHRNVQGVTVQPGTGRLFAAEHGPDVDDEINVLRPGANYGWDPARGGTETSYDESVPMTDQRRFPDAVPAVWSSGGDTEAICGAAFVAGEQWGGMQGLLAVAALKGSTLLLMRVGPGGEITEAGRLPQLDGTHGRLRAVRPGPDGALYVTTSNGDDDTVLRVAPSGS